MLHYLYSTRGGYLYLVGRYNSKPGITKSGEFVLSVPDKTPQAQIDRMVQTRFVEHLTHPHKKNVHESHKAKGCA